MCAPDAYFLVCNLTTECHDHVDVVIDFAIRMQDIARWDWNTGVVVSALRVSSLARIARVL